METVPEEEERQVSALGRFALLVIGMSVLALWVACVVGLVVFLIWVWPAFVGVAVGLILALAVFVSRPRVPRLPDPALVVGRGDAPELFRLIDAVSDELEAPRLRTLAFSGEVNASTMRVGFRRGVAIVVGAPLWEALDRQERVALLGHEIAHAVNGDVRRSLLVGTSIDVLDRWNLLTHPGSFRAASDRGLADAAGWLLMAVPHLVLEVLVRLQVRLTLDNQRRAEFAADRLAAEVAGTKGCLALFDRMVLSSSIEFAIKRAVQAKNPDTWQAIRGRFLELPADEREAIRRVAMDKQVSVDSTHPPTGKRILSVEAEPFRSPLLLLDSSWNDRIDRELEWVRTALEPHVRSEYSRSDRW